jgi:hypothetical protein
MDLPQVVAALNLPAPRRPAARRNGPRGYRLLHRLPQLSESWWSAWSSASAPARDHVGQRGRARVGRGHRRRHRPLVRDGLARLVEASIFERYE